MEGGETPKYGGGGGNPKVWRGRGEPQSMEGETPKYGEGSGEKPQSMEGGGGYP